MLKQKTVRKRRSLFTMIELMIVVIIVAILAASAVPLYRSAVSRAYDGEVTAALGAVRSAQRMYYAHYGEYAEGLNEADASDSHLGNEINIGDFRDIQHVRLGDSLHENGDDHYLAITDTNGGFTVTWHGTIDGYDYTEVSMDHNGNIERE